MGKGLVHIYCGDGKGKTTAAVGLAARCRGAGGRVLFFQFLKGNGSSERAALCALGVDAPNGRGGMKFVWEMTEAEKAETRGYYREIFGDIAARAAEYDMVVLDEIIPALKYDFIDERELIGFLKSRPAGTEIVMTGRDPSPELAALADYVTEMRKIKHPYDRGVAARRGIEM